MSAQVPVHEFASWNCSHVSFEVLIHVLELNAFFPEFRLYVARAEYILQINPIFLHN